MSDAQISPHDYVLGELSESELREADRLLREDAEFAAAVERLRPVVAALEDTPEEVWREIPAVEGDEAPVAAGPARWGPAWLRPALAGLAVVTAAVLAIALIADSDQRGAQTLSLEPLKASSEASGSAQLGGAGETASVEISGLERNEAGEFYELWLLNDADDLVSLGSFRVGGSEATELDLPLPVDPSRYKFIDVSVEPEDGDSSHSGRSVLRGSSNPS